MNGFRHLLQRHLSGGKPRYLLYVIPELSSPIVLVGSLRGTTLTIPVPLIPTLPGQPNATLTKFFVKTGGKAKKGKKKINYITNAEEVPDRRVRVEVRLHLRER